MGLHVPSGQEGYHSLIDNHRSPPFRTRLLDGKEVSGSQDARVQKFLLHTSILPDVRPLGDAVMPIHRLPGKPTLQTSNAPSVPHPLDITSRRRYRLSPTLCGLSGCASPRAFPPLPAMAQSQVNPMPSGKELAYEGTGLLMVEAFHHAAAENRFRLQRIVQMRPRVI